MHDHLLHAPLTDVSIFCTVFIFFEGTFTMLITTKGRLCIVKSQRTKKVVSDSPGLVDVAIGLANSVLNLPDGQVKYFEEFNVQKNCEITCAHQKILGLVEMACGLVHASFSLSEW